MIITGNDILKVCVLTVCILILDIAFISLNMEMWRRDVQIIQRSPLRLRFKFALITYILLVIGVCVFVLFSDTKTTIEKMSLGFVWGIITYGIFDFTNLSMFSNYKLETALTDTIWGGVMVALSVGLTEFIVK